MARSMMGDVVPFRTRYLDGVEILLSGVEDATWSALSPYARDDWAVDFLRANGVLVRHTTHLHQRVDGAGRVLGYSIRTYDYTKEVVG